MDNRNLTRDLLDHLRKPNYKRHLARGGDVEDPRCTPINMMELGIPSAHEAIFPYKYGVMARSYNNNPNNDYVFYFDSFGSPPNIDTERFLRTSGKPIKMNTSALQYLKSKACGFFVVWFIQQMNKYNDPYKVLYSMNQFNSIDNELMIKKYFNL